MVDHSHDTHDSTVRERTEIRETRTGGGSGIAFIVGGLVVAVGVIAYLIFGTGGGHMATDGGGSSTSSVNVNVGGSDSSGAAKTGGTTAKAGASDGSASAGASAGGSTAKAGASSTGSN